MEGKEPLTYELYGDNSKETEKIEKALRKAGVAVKKIFSAVVTPVLANPQSGYYIGKTDIVCSFNLFNYL